jgi:hypothetical protein
MLEPPSPGISEFHLIKIIQKIGLKFPIDNILV